MQLDLTDAKREALVRFLRDGIDRDRYPLSPRLAPMRAVRRVSPAVAPPSVYINEW